MGPQPAEFSFVCTTESSRRCQDKIAVIRHRQGLVAVLADGAGGVADGEDAAATVVIWTESYVDRTPDIRGPRQWVELLSRIDRQVSFAGGESTAVIVALFEDGLAGASVGDSVAWVIGGQKIDDLTAEQNRRPFIGKGNACPVAFARSTFAGTLLLASDGLVNYTSRQRIVETIQTSASEAVCSNLVNLVRLKSGELWDDVGIILCQRSLERPSQPPLSKPPPYIIP